MNMPMRLLLISLSILLSNLLSAQILEIDFDRPASRVLPEKSTYHHQINHYGDLEYVEDRFGNECRAANFTGSQFLEIPHHDVFNISDEFTAMSWIRLSDRRDFQWITLICKGLHQIETKNSPAFRVQMTSQTVSVNTSSTKEIDEVYQNYPREQWFHFATTFKNGEISLYVNGEKYKSFYTSTQLETNNHSVTVGYDIPGDEEYFVGAMDDLYFFDRALSEKEILSYATDLSNQNLGGICPVAPSINPAPQPLASKDPWSGFTIDEIDDDSSSQPVANNGNPPDKPHSWDDIVIDDVVLNEIPTKDPLVTNDPADPWEGLKIDEIDEDKPDVDLVVTEPRNDNGITPQLPILRPEPVASKDVTSNTVPVIDLPSKTINKQPLISYNPPKKVVIDSVTVPTIDYGRYPPPDSTSNDIPDPQAQKEQPEEPPVLIDSLDNNFSLDDDPILVNSMDSLTVGRKMILDKIEFARHSSHLNDRSKAVLKDLAEILRKNPDYAILLEGHTEIDGSREANLRLSQRRAEACKKYLVRKSKIKSKRIEVKFYGPDKPITIAREILWKNRRVEVTVY